MSEEATVQAEEFIRQQVRKISSIVGGEKAIAAVSGGVDSAVAFVLAKLAIGDRCMGLFIDTGLMRKGEPRQVESTFADLGYPIKTVDCQTEFGYALVGLCDPEAKREAISKVFYSIVFREQAKRHQVSFLVQGTIKTDVDETILGIKRQHNVLTQVGIQTKLSFGYELIEPLACIPKSQVREVAAALGLPKGIVNRMPFPGPGLACRIIGEVTEAKIVIVREATKIVEQEFIDWDLFQVMAILHSEFIPGMRHGRRDSGYQIEVRAWLSKDARTAKPFVPSPYRLERLSYALAEVPVIVGAVINFTPKPPSTMEAV